MRRLLLYDHDTSDIADTLEESMSIRMVFSTSCLIIIVSPMDIPIDTFPPFLSFSPVNNIGPFALTHIYMSCSLRLALTFLSEYSTCFHYLV